MRLGEEYVVEVRKNALGAIKKTGSCSKQVQGGHGHLWQAARAVHKELVQPRSTRQLVQFSMHLQESNNYNRL